jgi:hypothetical protein
MTKPRIKILRQGDVLLKRMSHAPKANAELRTIERDGDRIVLALGEATGHAHVIKEPDATLFGMAHWGSERRVLKVEGMAALRHDEHGEIQIPKGWWEVVRQREYEPRTGQNYVAD